MNTIKSLKFAILKNEDPFDHLLWVKACEACSDCLDYQVIDITEENWLEVVNHYSPDLLLVKPSGKTSLFRVLYLERLEILVEVLNYPSFPSINEVRIYENKRFFAYWAQANKIPHPKTWIFYNKKEALSARDVFPLPLVGKMNIGASGNGVRILRTMNEVSSYIKSAFNKGITSGTGPTLSKGKLFPRAWQKITHPYELLNRLRTYKDIASDRQKGFVILQQYIPHEYEWRAVVIGESYFAHKKMVSGEKASGSLIKKYENPPQVLLDFVRSLAERFQFKSVAIDFFEPVYGTYLVNEIQCIFGQSDPYQMLVDGKPGRYVHRHGAWVFEAGDFNANESYNLRVKAVIDHLSGK